jgi:HEAT repeat protein
MPLTSDGGVAGEIVVERSASVVWDYFAEPAHWAEWWGGELTAAQWRPGGQLEWKLGRPSSIVLVEPGKTVQWSGMTCDTTFVFEPFAIGATKVKARIGPLKPGYASTDGRASELADLNGRLAALKRCVERDTPARPAPAKPAPAKPSPARAAVGATKAAAPAKPAKTKAAAGPVEPGAAPSQAETKRSRKAAPPTSRAAEAEAAQSASPKEPAPDAGLAALIRALDSADDSGKYEAFEKLEEVAKSGEGSLLAPLTEMLSSGGNESREYAASLLGTLGDKRAVDALVRALEDPWWCTRYNAVEALGKIGDRRAIEPIRKLAETDPHQRVAGRAGIVVDEVFVRQVAQAAEGGTQASGGSAQSLVAALGDSDENARQSAFVALIDMGEPAVEPLIGALKTGTWGVRWYSARALGRIEDGRAVEPLIGALTDESNHVRAAAALALGLVGDGRALGPLNAALNDTDADVRDNASKALSAVTLRAAFAPVRATPAPVQAPPAAPAPAPAAPPPAPAAPAPAPAAPPPAPAAPAPAPAAPAPAPAAPAPAPAAPAPQVAPYGPAPARYFPAPAPPAYGVPQPVWAPTHRVHPAGGFFWIAPDVRMPPSGQLPPNLEVVAETSAGMFVLVRAVNGWRGWVDYRVLLPLRW